MGTLSHNADILERIDSFPRWHYQFDLKGHLTPIFEKEHINRHAQRKKYFLDPMVSWFGGSLNGKRVLDLACNAGFWSLCAIQAGCDYVLGIDGRPMHIDQANFVFEVNDVDRSRYDFFVENVFDVVFQPDEKFDIVLCLGLFYHINRHLELLTKISSINPDVLLIDTSLVGMPGSFFRLSHEDVTEPRNSVDNSLIYFPTAQAVLDLVTMFGYSTIMLKPSFEDYEGAEDYRLGLRRAFVSSRQSDLSAFPSQVETVKDLTALHAVAEASYEAQLFQCKAELARVLQSRSWKLTRPLRTIHDYLMGRPSNKKCN